MGCAGAGKGGIGFVPVRDDASQLVIRRGKAGIGGGGLIAEVRQGGGGAFQELLLVPPRRPRLLFCLVGGLGGGLGSCPFGTCRSGALFGFRETFPQSGQAIALLQADRGGDRRARTNSIAIPPRNSPGTRDQHLPRRQSGLPFQRR